MARKLLGIFKSIDLRFSNAKIEKEYRDIKSKDHFRDFEINIIALILITLTVVINFAARKDISSSFVAASITIAVLIFSYFLGRIFRKHVVLLTIAVLLAYNFYRLLYLHNEYETILKINMFFGGYTYAVFHMALISRIPKFVFKIFFVLFLYVVRFIVAIFWVDEKANQVALFIRIFILDAFILYFFYINEKSERRVFQTFSENNEELMKFKELLDESLPQSINIMSFDSSKSLFANKAFKETFEFCQSEKELSNNLENTETVLTQIPLTLQKIHFNFLQVDLSTIREFATLKLHSNDLNFQKNSMSLRKIITQLITENLLKESTLSLAATYSFQDQRKTFEVTLKKIKWNRENAIAVILNDITYQENLIALKVASVNKDKILSTVSHELRTPLHGIIGLISMAEEKVNSPEVSEYLSLGRNNAYLLLGVVNSILDFHQISTGKLRLSLTKVDLTKALTGVVKLFQFQAQRKFIHLELTTNNNIPSYVVTDEGRLKQILINLVGNAIKFTREGSVKVRVAQDSEDPERLEISVIDTGIGIKEEDQKNLFKLNGRMEDVASVNKHGVGLGLTISDALARMLDDRRKSKGIQVQSQYQKGSVFSFKILKDLSTISPVDLLKKDEANEERQINMESIPETKEHNLEDLLTPRHNNLVEREKADELSEEQITTDYHEDSLGSIKIVQKLTNYVSQMKMNINDINPNEKRLIFKERPSLQNEREEKEEKTIPEKCAPILELESEKNLNIDQQQHKADLVIVVDDNAFNLLVAENLMKDYPYNIKTALGGHEAIDLIKVCCGHGETIKAVLMDCQMPVIDGYETTKILINMMKKNEIPKIPIIAWTANNGEGDIQRCYDCGMSDYLSKPTSRDAIKKAFSKL